MFRGVIKMNNTKTDGIVEDFKVADINLSDFGKEGYELVNVITEPILDEKYMNNGKFLRTFFLKKERI